MFYPIGINLAFYTLTTLNALTALPLLLNFGVIAASNLHLWFSFTIGGYGVFLLTRYLGEGVGDAKRFHHQWGSGGTRKKNSSFVIRLSSFVFAGLIYAFASSKLFYAALGQFNIASAHWIPFSILFFIKAMRQPRNWRWAALSALFLTLQAWTEMTYASFLLIFMALYCVYWFVINLSRRQGDKETRRQGDKERFNPQHLTRSPAHPLTGPPAHLLIMALVFLIGISPILAAMLPDMLKEGDFLVVGGGFADAFSADLLGFFIPTMRHPLFGGLVAQTGISNYAKGQHIYLGYTLLALASLGLWANRRGRMAWFWFIASFIFGWLSLGPEIIFNGHNTHIPGPFIILQRLPFFKGNRYPSRYSVMLLLSLAPLAAMGVKRAGERGSRWAGGLSAHPLTRSPAHLLPLLIAALFLFEHLSVPLPQSNMTVPEAYQIIAQDEDDFAVLDIPFAWRNGFRISGAYTTGFMFGQFYQSEHQKPMLQGNTSRNPEFKFQYFTDAPVLSSLRILETGHSLPPEQWEADAAIAADALRFFNVKYIVVRPEEPSYLNDPAATIPYIEAVLPVEKLRQSPELTLYRVNLPPLPNEVTLLQSPLTPLYFGEGWGVPAGGQIIAQRKETRLLVPLNGKAQTLHLTVRLWTDEDAPKASGKMWVEMKGWKSKPLALNGEWRDLTLAIPAEALSAGLNDLRFHFDALNANIAPNPYPQITVISAGEEAGNLGHIYLGGVDVSPNQRGFNVAVIGMGGNLIDAAAFDAHADPAASRALAKFIAAAPDDALIGRRAAFHWRAGGFARTVSRRLRAYRRQERSSSL
ncbi:MAG: hypothetical protein B6243_13270 [Anaerolineaceae bacterium 4572_5.2]|nr:MAG: hypothetical protein B6243_13270 [Anaerolineaceae bacterium 4572_5.2]